MGKHRAKRRPPRRRSSSLMMHPVHHVHERLDKWKEFKTWATTHPVIYLPQLLFQLVMAFVCTGPRWLMMTLRLMIYGMLLMPAWARVGKFYLTSPNIVRNLRYGSKARNFLDVYVPSVTDAEQKEGCPVVIFIPGGAWIIGYKAWAALTGHSLIKAGVIYVTPDYRNFPQANAGEMLEDVRAAIQWVISNIHMYGGDTDRLYLGGQSAGAHLSALALVEAIENPHHFPVSMIRGWIGVSGPYNMVGLRRHFHGRGLHSEVFDSIMSVTELADTDVDELTHCSPALRVSDPKFPAHYFPPAYLLHGNKDKSCPVQSSVEFYKALCAAGAQADLKVYQGKTHTDSILEDLMGGWHKHSGDLTSDIIDIVTRPVRQFQTRAHALSGGRHGHAPQQMIGIPYEYSPSYQPLAMEIAPSPQLVSKILLFFARIVNPF